MNPVEFHNMAEDMLNEISRKRKKPLAFSNDDINIVKKYFAYQRIDAVMKFKQAIEEMRFMDESNNKPN